MLLKLLNISALLEIWYVLYFVYHLHPANIPEGLDGGGGGLVFIIH